MKAKILAKDLKMGMFVAELDCPWVDTPFAFQGFLLRNPEQIESVRRYCQFVYVDSMLSTIPIQPSSVILPDTGSGLEQTDEDGHSILALEEEAAAVSPTKKLFDKLRIQYPDLSTAEEELPVAERVRQRADEAVRALFDGVRSKGVLEGEQIREAIEEMTESVVRNPDALLLLTRLKQKSAYAYDHALSVAVHLLAFGRHLGFPKAQLQLLGTAGMLLDIGMVQLPAELLQKREQLTPDEFETIRSHVRLGVEVVRRSEGVDPRVVEIVAQHHEREDGSGYPSRLKAQQIGMLGKMAAIVDTFEALTSERPYASPSSPFQALQTLYDWRKQFFHEELVENFIQTLGVYPVGSLVELNSGEVAIVLAHNRTRRLKPRVMVILGPDKKPYASPRMMDMLMAPDAFEGEPYEIRRTLVEGMYGIDPRDYYL